MLSNFRLTISNKLYLGGACTVTILIALLLINLSTYSQLYQGFEQIVDQTKKSSGGATSSSENLAAASLKMEQLSADMLQLAEKIELLNQKVKAFEGDITQFANSQVFIIEELELVAEEIEDDDTLEMLEGIVDSVNQSGENIGQNGVVSLNTVMQQMRDFTGQINQASEHIKSLSGQMSESQSLSEEVATTNSAIEAMSMVFAKDIETSQQFTTLIAVIAALLVSVAIFIFTRAIVSPLKQAIGLAGNIAAGNFNSSVCASSEDEIGELIDAMCSMQRKLNQVISQDVAILVKNAKAGDLSGRINLDNLNGGYQELCSGINALVNESEGIVDDAARVLTALAKGDFNERITQQYHGKFGELKEDANLITDSLQQVIENEIQPLVVKAKNGDLGERIEIENKSGFYLNLSQAINELLRVNGNIIQDASLVLGAMSQGDLSKSITNQYQGAFATLAENINNTRTQLQQTIELDVQAIIDAARAGELKSQNCV